MYSKFIKLVSRYYSYASESASIFYFLDSITNDLLSYDYSIKLFLIFNKLKYKDANNQIQ